MGKRDPFDAPHVESRRGGPAKVQLSRDLIVNEALGQITSEGLAGMSLRKVAKALDTGPASLYAYIEDLEELHALVLDRALANVELPNDARVGWRERLQSLLESYCNVLMASPGLARLAFGSVAIGPNALRITERVLALLEEGGVDLATGAWAVDLLLLYVTAIAAEHADGHEPANPEGAVARALAGASARDYPRVHAARAQLLSGTGEERFAWAIEVFLRGILQTPRESPVESVVAAKPRKQKKSPRR